MPGSVHSGLFGGLVRGYIEETAAYSPVIMGADVTEVTTLPPSGESKNTAIILQTIENSYLAPATSAVSSLVDEVGDRGNRAIDYEIQEGDTISSIASDFGVSVNAIIWSNRLKNINALTPGAPLKIPPVTGIIHVVVKGDTVSTISQKYGADGDKIIAFNSLSLNGDLQIGQEVIVPDGTVKPDKQLIDGNTSRSSRLAVERFSQLPTLDGYFIIPARGTKTQGIHGRNGVDWANVIGTPVVAAADGTVTVAKGMGLWDGGYGNYIKISHPNGTETLYAHLSKVFVTVGQQVSQGEHIGNIGSTGKSTGPHLHYEVHNAKNNLAQLRSNL